MLGNYEPCEKVPTPPYLAGDVVYKQGGVAAVLGRLITYQDATGDKTSYMLNLHGVPIKKWRELLMDGGKTGIWLDVQLED